MQRFIKLILVLALSLGAFSIVNAQDQKPISPEKRKLIAELISLTKAGAQVTEISDTLLESMEKSYPLVIKQSLRSYDQMSQSEQDKISASLTESYLSFSKKFRKRLPQVINYEQFVNDLVYPLYDKYYSEKELADLVAFYKTETGQKVVTTMPILMAESTKLSETLLVPKLLELVDKIIKEELNNFEEELTKDEG
jgi:hypothetical protein